MTVLLTGGCGYIGRQLAWTLIDAGRNVVIIDDLSSGDRGLTPEAALVVPGDVRDRALLGRIMRDQGVEAVVHLAGVISVAESMTRPAHYYGVNTGGTAAVVEACIDNNVDRLVFSSTAAVYGKPQAAMVPEDHPAAPMSPYGRSKHLAEEIIRDSSARTPLRSVILRYFNVAGADPLQRTGQSHPDTSHLIINALRVAKGEGDRLDIYGDDYDTFDGTGVRDFIHVADLASVHVRALDHLASGGEGGVFNCGYGRGYSVKQVIAAVERVTGRNVDSVSTPRREGDIPAMVADPTAGLAALGWHPSHDDLDAMIASAWSWETRAGAGRA